ncbi:hypothetical protein [Shinella sp.]|uniref:hypothetical protein n=1 Tax=Shinella sp. TaxID=1870904 RepID=UPI0029BD1432|nr:hypothetical protein [Shinella sp.]MDX3976994.1 hypothetical protein [Shinella sp.]
MNAFDNVVVLGEAPSGKVKILPDEVMTIAEAAVHAGKTTKTIRRWCDEFGISRQVRKNSPVQVSRIALDMVIHGDWPALDCLKVGDRTHRLVTFYRVLANLD